MEEAHAGITIARRNINMQMICNMTCRYANDTTIMAESREKLKSILMKVKEETEKAGLKLKFKK